MIRTYITPQNQDVVLKIPKHYVGKELEVLVFSTREMSVNPENSSKKVTFSSIAIDTRGFKFNREEANER